MIDPYTTTPELPDFDIEFDCEDCPTFTPDDPDMYDAVPEDDTTIGFDCFEDWVDGDTYMGELEEDWAV